LRRLSLHRYRPLRRAVVRLSPARRTRRLAECRALLQACDAPARVVRRARARQADLNRASTQ
jgi:hypothetical protein